METFDLERYPSNLFSIASTPPHGLHDDFNSPPFPLPFDNHSLYPRFPPTSPSPDLEAILERIGSDDPGRPGCSSNDSDVLMADLYLDYVNELLMSGEADASLPPDDAQASYGTILRGFYDVIGEPLPLDFTSSMCSTSLVESSVVSLSPHIDQNNSASSTDSNSNDDLHTRVLESCREPSFGTGGKGLDGEVLSARIEAKDRPGGARVSDGIDTSFEDLKIEEDYASLYIGALSLSGATNAGKANSRNVGKKSSSRAVRQSGQAVPKAVSAAVDFVTLRELLVSSAQAMAIGNMKRANEILFELYSVHGVSPQGNSVQRLANYFCDALVTRIGIGSQEHGIPQEIVPPIASLAKSLRLYYHSVPILKVMYYFSNQKILKAAEQCARLHILDFGGLHDMQWPCLIKALADRDGGPPLLVITGIATPWPAVNFLEKLKETGQRLAAYASKWNVPFQYHALLSEKWEDINPDNLQLHKGEVLVINSNNRLNHIPDECTDPSSFDIPPRQRLLMNMRSLNPHLLLLADLNMAGNSPFFVSRFREVVHYLHNHADMLETVFSDESDRFMLQGSLYHGLIHDTLAFDGAERVKRPEVFKQWDFRLKRAGFELLPFPAAVMSRAVLFVKQHYHRNFMVVESANGWVLLGWKGRTLQYLSAWKPSQKDDKIRRALDV